MKTTRWMCLGVWSILWTRRTEYWQLTLEKHYLILISILLYIMIQIENFIVHFILPVQKVLSKNFMIHLEFTIKVWEYIKVFSYGQFWYLIPNLWGPLLSAPKSYSSITEMSIENMSIYNRMSCVCCAGFMWIPEALQFFRTVCRGFKMAFWLAFSLATHSIGVSSFLCGYANTRLA